MQEEKNLLFVYGTLLSFHPRHQHFLAGEVAEVIPARIRGQLYHLPQGYPAVIKGEGEVRGEVLRLFSPERVLPRLDSYEGYDPLSHRGYYLRELTEAVRLDTGEKLLCYAYFVSPEYEGEVREEGVFIPEGDWQQYISRLQYLPLLEGEDE